MKNVIGKKQKKSQSSSNSSETTTEDSYDEGTFESDFKKVKNIENPVLGSTQFRASEHMKTETPMVDLLAQGEAPVFTKPIRELTIEEISALESLVYSSSVEKERKMLTNMKVLKTNMDTEALLATGRIGHASKREKKSTDRMMGKLGSMINNLEQELEKVDNTIGDRLNFLDKDQDGVLSADELKAAVKNILRKHNTEEDAAWAVSQIDENKDGVVTVAELVNWIEKRTNLFELTGESSNYEKSSTSTNSHDEDMTKKTTSTNKV